MSWQPAVDPSCEGAEAPRGVETVIVPRAHDLGGFEVRRALPAKERQMVGPFIFFDQMGPGEFLAGRGLDVRPHPHIGLATVTYLFEGEILHRDSLGTSQPIRPGDVNWMTAGRGIAHSERTDPAQRGHANRLFGIQSWVALPKAQEETAPAFAHHPAATLPVLEEDGVRLRLVAGDGLGRPLAGRGRPRRCSTPTRTSRPAPPCRCPRGTRSAAPTSCDGAVEVAGDVASRPGGCCCSAPATGWRCGRGPRARGCCCWAGRRWTGRAIVFWNFVSSSRERIEQAKADWKAGRFGKVPGDEKEFIPLPEERVRAEPAARVSDGSPTS